jgi:DNA repair ATPase RecN
MISYKDAAKRLTNYEYVMRLTSLTPFERDFLSKKYIQRIYKKFPITYKKVKTVAGAALVFQQSLTKIEKFIKDNDIQNVIVDNRYSRHALTVTGTKIVEDRVLLRKLKTDIKRIKKYNDQMKARAQLLKKQEAEQNKRWAEEEKIRKNNLKRSGAVIICSNDKEAKMLIDQLKSQFNL